MGARRLLLVTLTILLAVYGCKKNSNNPVASSLSAPGITSIVPDTVVAGDTVRILGTGFGDTQGSSTVNYNGSIAPVVVFWSASEIRFVVPAGATSGTIIVVVGGYETSDSIFVVQGTTSGVSFAGFVQPVFRQRCISCHGGQGGLYLDSYANLMSGTSLHGPVVVAGNGEGSVLIQKLRGTAGFGSQMPLGGPYLSAATIDSISLWIQQGAKNN